MAARGPDRGDVGRRIVQGGTRRVAQSYEIGAAAAPLEGLSSEDSVQGRLSSYEVMPAHSTYPKNARLRRKADFARVLSTGDVFPGREALVRRAPNDVGHARLGLSTPRRYGNAVRRNAFRRLAREAFRTRSARAG